MEITNEAREYLQRRAKEVVEDNIVTISEGLVALLHTQAYVSALGGCSTVLDPVSEPSKEELRTVFLALFVETGELLQELDWKPWRTKPSEVDKDKIAAEFADILAFTGLLLNYLAKMGISAAALSRAYKVKTHINVARINSGTQ